MSRKKKIIASIAFGVFVICLTLDGMGYTPQFKTYFDVIELLCFVVVIIFVFEKPRISEKKDKD